MRYLTVEEVITLNQYMIQTYSPNEQIGVKDASVLESAIYRPQQSVFGEDAYGSFFEKAGALFESIAQNHAFYNANKRTALISLAFFLEYNGYFFAMETTEKIEFTVDVVNRKYSLKQIAGIIEEHAKRK